MSEYTREALLARAETAEARIKVLEAALYPLVVGCLEADAREDAPEFVNGEAERGRDSLPKCGRCGGCGALDGVEYVDTAIPEAVLCPDCGGWGFLKHALEHAAAPQEPTDLAAASSTRRRDGGRKENGEMIVIHQSSTADTRTCDFTKVSEDQLFDSSLQHIEDVRLALRFFADCIHDAAAAHDRDKLTDIAGFHADFVTGFKQTGWWDAHRRLNRHHLTQDDGIPPDVNLVDVLDFIADCTMAGMGRSGDVYPLHLPPELLERAFQNTAAMLKAQVVVEP